MIAYLFLKVIYKLLHLAEIKKASLRGLLLSVWIKVIFKIIEAKLFIAVKW